MKALSAIVILMAISASTFAQDNGDYDDLMQKSRRARTTSTILVATGPVIAAAGIGTLIYGLVSKEDIFTSYDIYGDPIPAKNYHSEIIVGAAAALTGIAMALTSIHFSNKASDLKREARKTRFKTSLDHIAIPGLQNGLVNNRARQFKLSLIVPLGK